MNKSPFLIVILSLLLSSTTLALDCRRDDLTQIEKAECEKIRANTLEQRLRNSRMREAVKNTFDNSVLVASRFDPAPSNTKYWDKLNGYLQSIIVAKYHREAHYLDVETAMPVGVDKIDELSAYELKSLSNKKIISMIIFRPKNSGQEKSATAIYNHGGDPDNFFKATSYNPYFFALAQLGYAIVCPNYRGGSADNHDQDMSAVVKYLRSLDFVDGKKIVLSGISAGTTLNAMILDRPVMHELAGLFLHTGLYNQFVFDPLLKVPKDLPVFLVSGANDKLVDLPTTMKYVRAFENISKNFNYFIVKNGGHSLIQRNDKSYEHVDVTSAHPTRSDISQAVVARSKIYNAEEIMTYLTHLVEFLDTIAHGPMPTLPVAAQDEVKRSPASDDDLFKRVRVLQEFKTGRTLARSPATLAIEGKLKEAAYTFSQAHLKIVIKEKYTNQLRDDVVSFLRKYDGEKRQIRDEHYYGRNATESDLWQRLLNETSSENMKLVELIEKILNKEKDYQGSYAIYHATNAVVAFVYEIYSALRSVMLIQAPSEDSAYRVTRLRALDEKFINFLNANDLVHKMDEENSKGSGELFNYLPGYQGVGLSGQWFLFGSYEYWFNSTFFNYFLEGATGVDVDVQKTLSKFFREFGVVDDDDLVKIVKNYEDIFSEFMDEKSSMLLQIFISPKIIDEVAYVSERGGYPLELEIPVGSRSTFRPSKIVRAIVDDPLTFETALVKNRNNFKHQKASDRTRFTQNKPELNYVDSMEARLFMKPEYMDDPTLIQIINYYQSPPKEGFHRALQKRAALDIAQLVKANARLGVAMKQDRPALLRLREHLVGTPSSLSSVTLYDLLSAGKWDDAEKWLISHPDHINIKTDDAQHSILYQMLADNKFQAAQWLVDRGASVNAKNIYKQSMIAELLTAKKMAAVVFLARNNAVNKKIAELALFEAITNNDTPTAVALINNGVSVDARNERGNTPLMLAVIEGMHEVVTSIVEKKRTAKDFLRYLNQRNFYGDSALILALKEKKLKTIAERLIDEGADINARTSYGVPLIYWALKYGYTSLIDKMIALKVNLLTTYDYEQSSSLIVSFLLEDRFTTAKLLTTKMLDNNIGLNIKDNLKTAIMSDNEIGAKRLAKNSLDFRQVHNESMYKALSGDDWRLKIDEVIKNNPDREVQINVSTPEIYKKFLYVLLERKKYEQAQALMTNGANANALQVINKERLDKKQKFPLLLDVLLWDPQDFDHAMKAAEILIKNGADPNMHYEDGYAKKPILNYLLNMPAREKEIEFLLMHGARLDVKIKQHPLFLDFLMHDDGTYLKQYGDLLVKYGADVNGYEIDNGKFIPILFQLMSKANNFFTAQWLIDKGAKVDLRFEEDDFTILLKSLVTFKSEQALEWAKFLIKNGANVNATFDDNGEAKPIVHHLLMQPDMNDEIKLFLARGAHPNATIGEEKYPLLLVNGLIWSEEYLHRYGKILIDYGANVNARTKFGETILTVLLKNSRFVAAEFIFNHGGKIDAGDLDKAGTDGKKLRQIIIDGKSDILKKLLQMR